MIRTVLAVAIFTITLDASAHRPIAKRLWRLDSNHDHALSLAEALNARQARFMRLDIDSSQSLTLTEISSKARTLADNASQANSVRMQSWLKRITKRFAQLDSDNNGLISPNEWDAQVVELFARFDANDDHVVTLAELRNARRERTLHQ